MLSRTAANLYWLSRYVERADNTARIIGTAQRLSALPMHYGRSTNEWESAVASTGSLDDFYQLYDVANRRNVIEFLAFSQDNPSSIRNCFAIARSNARAVRTALTIEMWESINDAWHDLNRTIKVPRTDAMLTEFLAWVERVSLSFDGSAYRTMLRSDSYWFSRLGVGLERADSDGAHSRRQISCPPAAKRTNRRQPGLFSMVGDPPVGFRPHLLPLGL